MNSFYFDWAATSPMSNESIEEYALTARDFMANPSAAHHEGQKSHVRLQELRKKASELLGCKSENMFFTSGGTESDSIILNSALLSINPGNIIISQAEHSAIKQYATVLKQMGWSISYLPCPHGKADIDSLKKLLVPETRFIFIMLVNNVLGTIEDISAIVGKCREYEKNTGRHIHVHTDAVQACGKIPINLEAMDVDSAAFSAHKFCGPRGVGMLYCRNKSIKSISTGGGQESGIRPGTENLSGIAAMVKALEIAVASHKEHFENAMKNKKVLSQLLETNGFEILSPLEGCSPFILNVSTSRIPSEVFVRVMSDRGYCLSAGSACNNNSKKKVEGLNTLGFSEKQSSTSVRISFGFDTDRESSIRLGQNMISVLKELSL